MENPPQHASGDFCLDGETVRYASERAGPTTYAGTGVFSPRFFDDVPDGAIMALRRLDAVAKISLPGNVTPVAGSTVGTPERLAELDQKLREA